ARAPRAAGPQRLERSFEGFAPHLVQTREPDSEARACILDAHLVRDRCEQHTQALLQLLWPPQTVDMIQPHGWTPEPHRFTSTCEPCAGGGVRQAETASQEAPGRAI